MSIKYIKVFAVIDTNVLVSSMRNKTLNSNIDSAVTEISRLIEKGNIIPLFDERILSEYYAVLNYSKFGFSDIPNVIDSQMNLVLSKGIYVNKVKEILGLNLTANICLLKYMKEFVDTLYYMVLKNTEGKW